MNSKEKAASKWADKECRKCCKAKEGCFFLCPLRDAGKVGFLAGMAWQKKQALEFDREFFVNTANQAYKDGRAFGETHPKKAKVARK